MSDTRTCANCRHTRFEKHAGRHDLVCWHPSRNGAGRRVEPENTCEKWTERGNDYHVRGRRYGQ